MRRAVLAVILLAAGGSRADAGVGPALDLGLAVGIPSGDVAPNEHAFGHAGFGIQVGRIAALVHVEAMDFGTVDESLDSPELEMRGRGVSVRVELARDRHYYVHLRTGYTWRRFGGTADVRRGCTVFGGCDAGFYREVPAYEDAAPWMSIGVGIRAASRIWPAIGGELGIAPLTIDRSGDAADAQGAMVWLGLNLSLGAD